MAVIPLSADAARCRAAILSLRGAGLLTGARGGPRMDVEAAASLASRVGGLLLEWELDLIELNPVAVHHQGAVALDAVARRR